MKSHQIKQPSLLISAGIGAVVAMCASIILSFVYPVFIFNEAVTESSVRFVAPASQMIATLLGSIIAGVLAKENKIPAVGISVGIYITVLICSALLFFDGLTTKFVFGVVAVLTGAVLALVFNGKKKKRSRGLHKKVGNR